MEEDRCVKRLKMRKASGVCGVLPDVKVGGEVVRDVVQYGMESRCGPKCLEESSTHPHLQEGYKARML